MKYALPLLLLILSLSGFSQTQTITGKVVGVFDGDTITVLDSNKRKHKIRLAGIDAPEAGQDFAQKAKRNLSRIVFGKTVQVESNKTDRYGRIVGKLVLNGIDINLEQIKNGFAWHYKEYENEQSRKDRDLYAGFERLARQFSLGLWAGKNPRPPWEFRHREPAEPVFNGKIMGNRNSMIFHWAVMESENQKSFAKAFSSQGGNYELDRD